MKKLTISDMKARSKDFFFSKATMKAFKGSKYKAYYDRKSRENYIKVISKTGTQSWYYFGKDGKAHYRTIAELPASLRKYT